MLRQCPKKAPKLIHHILFVPCPPVLQVSVAVEMQPKCMRKLSEMSTHTSLICMCGSTCITASCTRPQRLSSKKQTCLRTPKSPSVCLAASCMSIGVCSGNYLMHVPATTTSKRIYLPNFSSHGDISAGKRQQNPNRMMPPCSQILDLPLRLRPLRPLSRQVCFLRPPLHRQLQLLRHLFLLLSRTFHQAQFHHPHSSCLVMRLRMHLRRLCRFL